MRKQPAISAPDVQPQAREGIITLTREYELITPLFGGGVDPAKADPVTVVRGTEIRGQLRFWWRACRGGKYNGDLATMKKAEDALWGAAYNKDHAQDQLAEPQKERAQPIVQLSIEVLPQKRGSLVEPFEVGKNQKGYNVSRPNYGSGIPDYAAFPLQHTREELNSANPPHHYALSGVAFRLTISYSEDMQKDVQAALWAWETFGGIGARTRRGFGALHLLNATPNNIPPSFNTEDWLRKKLAYYVEQEHFPQGIPHLSPKMGLKVMPARPDSMQSWRDLINKLKSFRQFDRPGPAKKSLWPEAGAIRQLTKGQKTSGPFPRAAFGLPIIFHFKDDNPADTTLSESSSQPDEKRERLASPLILRPLACNDNRTVGLAALLEGSRVQDSLELKEEGGHGHPVRATLTPQEVKRMQLSILNGKTDVLQEFLNFL